MRSIITAVSIYYGHKTSAEEEISLHGHTSGIIKSSSVCGLAISHLSSFASLAIRGRLQEGEIISMVIDRSLPEEEFITDIDHLVQLKHLKG